MYKVSTKVPGRYARTVKNDIKSKEDAMTCAIGAITAYGYELAARKMLKVILMRELLFIVKVM